MNAEPEPTGTLEGAELVDWRALPPGQRRGWWQRLWQEAIALSVRYRVALRSGWWQDAIQVEALAAFCCWLRLYDTGAETDPTGKLQLLWELDRLRIVLRAGDEPFDAEHDRAAFEEHLRQLTAPRRQADTVGEDVVRRQLIDELSDVTRRLEELREREHTLQVAVDGPGCDRPDRQARRELEDLHRAVRHLADRQGQLRRQLEPTSAGG